MNDNLSDKDKKDWKKFIESEDRLEIKENNISNKSDQFNDIIVDLHGYTLDEANKKISEVIIKCYTNQINKLTIITGKGTRSKIKQDPYQSEYLGILKYSVPDYIKKNEELMKKIKFIDFESIENLNLGSFYILLKKKN